LNGECWWDIEGYGGKYQISTEGRVRSFANNGKKLSLEGRILKTSLTDRGYVRVTLRKDKKASYFKVHRLVARAFLENPFNYVEINHIDGDKTNNHIDNIEWCSRSHNLLHAYRTGLKPRHWSYV